ncbi:MAG TPA: FtsX-like permease family protein [Chryseosolibacter sp.]|nr:FtsX-like permease family protein [Chryseosolibacter sp.]
MLKNYLLITIRNMMKNKLFIFINVLGLGFAIVLCIIAYLNWKFREDWDQDQKHAETIYRVQFWHESPGKRERWGCTPMPLGDHIRQDIAGMGKVVNYVPYEANFRIGDELFQTSVGYADSLFFEVFSFDLIHGNPQDFKKPGTVFITDELARIYFDREDVAGEPVTQVIDGVPHEFVVGGVFRKPKLNSSFWVNAFTLRDNLKYVHISTDDWRSWNTTFIQVPDPADVPAISKQLQQYIEPQNRAREDFKITRYYLENFKGIARRSVEDPRIKGNQIRSAMPKAVVDMPCIIAGLLLLLACFNFTNTSIALCGRRLKEIGIRKVMGGVRRQLIIQFLTESLLLCFLGLLTGLLLAEYFVPAYDNLWTWLELDLSYSNNLPFLLFLIFLLLLTAILAGGYAAFYITSFEPVSILKGRAKFGGTSWLTRTLLCAQFSIAILTIIFGVGFYQNARYQKNYDLGYHTSGVISSYIKDEAGFNTFRDALSGNPHILTIAGTKHHLLNGIIPTSVKHESDERQVEMMEVGDQYLEAMNIRVVAGRPFTKDSRTDARESVLVSEEFVKQFKWNDNPVGKRILWMDTVQLYVIGVVKDIYSRALFRPVEPVVIRYAPPSEYSYLVASMPPEKMAEVNEFMRQQWKTVFPNVLYNGEFIDNKMQETIETNNNVVIVFSFIGFFALLMSATGLYTLVSLQILKRTKEIGVRKVLGASFVNILSVISFEFLLVILVGCLIGGAIGYVLVDVSLDAAWEYYEKVTLSTFATSVSVIFVLAVVSTGFKTIATAKVNPVKTLRTE